MSAPAFAPGLLTHIPTHLVTSNDSSTRPLKRDSFNSTDQASSDWRFGQQQPKHDQQHQQHSRSSHSLAQYSPQSTASSSASSTTTDSSASPRSDALTASSSILGHSGLTSLSSLKSSESKNFTPAPVTTSPEATSTAQTTPVSSSECVRMDEDLTTTQTVDDEMTSATYLAPNPFSTIENERPGSAASRAMAGLSVHENDPSPTPSDKKLSVDTSDETIATSGSNLPGSKIRRASALSSSSAQHPEEGAWKSGSKSGRDSLPSRKKAPRMGSFEARSGDVGSAMTKVEEGIASRSRTPSSQAESSMSSQPQLHSQPQPLPLYQPQQQQQQQQHVDIVSYPSTELLKLLASLLEQIAHANDALHQRTQASRSGSTSPNVPGSYSNESSSSFGHGRFDAAPLNSPATPRYRTNNELTMSIANASTSSLTTREDEETNEMPVTPGVDLLREVGEGGGVEGFMPSLGGTHQPQPLSRRRGSSFLKSRRDEGLGSNMSRRASAAMLDAGPMASSNATGSTSTISSTSPSDGRQTAQPNWTGGTNNSSSNSTSGSSSPDAPLSALFTASSQALSSPSATLCFHARNVPAISIEAYLLRILKYCPTTNEVFLSLLVYFDRMARVGLEAQRAGIAPSVTTGSRSGNDANSSTTSRLFAIDSFNVHRLVIAGVTVASKFFSDVFYTNSRYAKVGGLPLTELNQLELQFLLLNDFRLVVPVDELQRYADQLILFWVGRNGQQSQQHPAHQVGQSQPPSTHQQPSSIDPQAAAPVTNTNGSQPGTSFSQHYQNDPSQTGTTTPTLQTSNQFSHSTTSGTSSSTASSSYSTTNVPQRPQSIRSQPSSSGTSVASTVTPGTPASARHERSSSEEYGVGAEGGDKMDQWTEERHAMDQD
ncbi:cyclin-like protein interacting with PHO85 [Microbotryomycetes sp. JL221]|nr:cyclin-like protein interacting with PHO85 [Microbotryomycetes sp. JL221]